MNTKLVIIDLTDLEKSEIKYKISNFPDGQQDITLRLSEFSNSELFYKTQIKLISRFNNWKDLELIIAANAALRQSGFKIIHLYIPYLLGARADIKFQFGGSNYLVDVIAPVLNQQNFESITVHDVHSTVANACIKNLRVITNDSLIEESLKIIGYKKHENNFIFVSPDGGALKKIYKNVDYLKEKFDFPIDVITCSKSRDVNGKLSRVNVPYSKECYGKDIIIIDDICDGGRTFINIAKELRETYLHENKIYLIVTHGIFSAGYEELMKYFDQIFCTNSYKDAGTGFIDKSGHFKKHNIKQISVI